MGWDVNGSIEITHGKGWIKVIDIGVFAGREYGLWGVLFGVKGQGPENAIAADRGLPEGLSEETQAKWDKADLKVHTTWLLDSELTTCIWDLLHNRWTQIDWSWRFIVSTMRTFGRKYGRRNVRIVVWFDY